MLSGQESFLQDCIYLFSITSVDLLVPCCITHPPPLSDAPGCYFLLIKRYDIIFSYVRTHHKLVITLCLQLQHWYIQIEISLKGNTGTIVFYTCSAKGVTKNETASPGLPGIQLWNPLMYTINPSYSSLAIKYTRKKDPLQVEYSLLQHLKLCTSHLLTPYPLFSIQILPTNDVSMHGLYIVLCTTMSDLYSRCGLGVNLFGQPKQTVKWPYFIHKKEHFIALIIKSYLGLVAIGNWEYGCNH